MAKNADTRISALIEDVITKLKAEIAILQAKGSERGTSKEFQEKCEEMFIDVLEKLIDREEQICLFRQLALKVNSVSLSTSFPQESKFLQENSLVNVMAIALNNAQSAITFSLLDIIKDPIRSSTYKKLGASYERACLRIEKLLKAQKETNANIERINQEITEEKRREFQRNPLMGLQIILDYGQDRYIQPFRFLIKALSWAISISIFVITAIAIGAFFLGASAVEFIYQNLDELFDWLAWPVRLIIGLPLLLLSVTLRLVYWSLIFTLAASVLIGFSGWYLAKSILYFPLAVIDSPSSILLAAAAVALSIATFGTSPLLLAIAGTAAGLFAVGMGTLEDIFPALQNPYVKWPLITVVAVGAAIALTLTLIWGVPAIATALALISVALPTTLLYQGLLVGGIGLLAAMVPIISTLLVSVFSSPVEDIKEQKRNNKLEAPLLSPTDDPSPLATKALSWEQSAQRTRFVVSDGGIYLRLFKKSDDVEKFTSKRKDLQIDEVQVTKTKNAAGSIMTLNQSEQVHKFFKPAEQAARFAPDGSPLAKGEYLYLSPSSARK